MSAIELYNAPQSTCSQKVRLTLAEKGLAFKEHRLKLFAGTINSDPNISRSIQTGSCRQWFMTGRQSSTPR